jgi:hypothetical protein
MGRKHDTVRQRGDVGQRKDGTREGKWKRRRQLGWRESYWAKKWRKSTWSIQLLQIDGEDLKQWWVIFFWKYMQVRSSFVHEKFVCGRLIICSLVWKYCLSCFCLWNTVILCFCLWNTCGVYWTIFFEFFLFVGHFAVSHRQIHKITAPHK